MANKKEAKYFFGVGRRKTAVARARIVFGASGEILVNGKPAENYFSTLGAKALVEVFKVTGTLGKFVATITVSGSGKSGQLGAAGLALARALLRADTKHREVLAKNGFLTRDPRARQREKAGLMGARKQKQSPKR